MRCFCPSVDSPGNQNLISMSMNPYELSGYTIKHAVLRTVLIQNKGQFINTVVVFKLFLFFSEFKLIY